MVTLFGRNQNQWRSMMVHWHNRWSIWISARFRFCLTEMQMTNKNHKSKLETLVLWRKHVWYVYIYIYMLYIYLPVHIYIYMAIYIYTFIWCINTVLQLIWGLWKWILGSFQLFYIWWNWIVLWVPYYFPYEVINWLIRYYLTIGYLIYLFVFYHAHGLSYVHYYVHS